jgi:asparagine synthase (glutamine-hydrolysing)
MISDRLELDRAGVLAAWGEVDDPDATVVAGIRRAPALALERVELRAWKWIEVFERAVAQLALQSTDPVVALGGGCDAAAVLVAWHASGLPMPHACTLAVGLDGYDEVETALAIAEQLHVDCEVIEIDPATLVELAPEAAAIAGTPLYNLHPVHRLALARALPGATLVTGDGADAVFAGVPDLDYVPIVAALSEPVSPFFDAAVVEGAPRDPAKQLLRDYLEVHGLGWLAERPKQPRLVPPLELEPILDRERIARLARALELEPRLDEDRRRVGWATLDHLVRSLERS